MQVAEMQKTTEVQTVSRLSRLQQLIRIYESGHVSELMDQTLRKLLSVEAAEEQKMVQLLREDLDELETRFGMESSIFFERFEKGEMGDDLDYMEWASLYQMYERASKRLRLLTGQE